MSLPVHVSAFISHQPTPTFLTLSLFPLSLFFRLFSLTNHFWISEKTEEENDEVEEEEIAHEEDIGLLSFSADDELSHVSVTACESLSIAEIAPISFFGEVAQNVVYYGTRSSLTHSPEVLAHPYHPFIQRTRQSRR